MIAELRAEAPLQVARIYELVFVLSTGVTPSRLRVFPARVFGVRADRKAYASQNNWTPARNAARKARRALARAEGRAYS